MKSIKLEVPLYYKSEYALRFELGPPDIGLWINREESVINEEYFRVAFQRALSIFNSAFSPSDEIEICYQIFSDGRRRIRKSDYFFKLTENLVGKPVKFSEHREIYSEDLERKRHCWKRVTISAVSASELHIEKVIDALINSDFGIRGPNLRGELYIINVTKGLVYHIYDDRGMDLVSECKEPLVPIYHQQHKWLLDYDKDDMDRQFSQI